MKKEDIINDIVSKKVLISTDKNYLQLFNNIDISMYGAKAWAFTLQEIGKRKGNEYLFNLGKIMGKDASEEVKENLQKLKVFLSEKFQLLPNIIQMTGFGIVELKEDKPSKKIIIEVSENHIINIGKENYGKDSLICEFYSGVYSGFIETFLEIKNCKLKHSKCISKGEEKCIFLFEE